MKRIFSLMAAALVSVVMLAGANDLLWDYTEAAPPTSGTDNGLTYNVAKGIINDAPGTKNGLKGVKLNDGGYAYFKKAAVPGKLRLGFGPRDGSNEASINIYTWDGEDTPPAISSMTLITTTKALTEYGFAEVTLTDQQNHIYLCRGTTKETALQYIQFKEIIPRTFQDFKLEFRDNPYSILLPDGGSLPTSVEVNCPTYNGPQHGIQGGTITVPVDGTVKFTIGACQHSNGVITVKKDGVDYTTISNNAACGETKPNYNQFVTYYYTGEAATLTFSIGDWVFVPYFFAEATEVSPCKIIFKDQNGTELGVVNTYEGMHLDEIPYTESDLPSIPDGYAFRGWFYTNNQKAAVGDPINGNTTIQAKVTAKEYATVGSVQTYNFTDKTFYPEDHETVRTNNGAYHDPQHGWVFDYNGSIKVKVAGKAVVAVTLCTYSNNGTVVLRDPADNQLGRFDIVKETTPDASEFVCQYSGEAGELSIEWTSMQYIHKVVVYNVLDFMTKDPTTGYYMVPKDDAASFLMALVQANGEGNAKIFLPNGLYDLGETVLTTISANNISIIGQSMEGTVIKNAPSYLKESIDGTATLKINKNVKGTYLQDLTIQNALDYYKNNNGRAVCLWDQGTQTICKNVRLLSYQDTYYSNLQGAVKYFEDCEIHGTVDFICGDGSVYFKNNILHAEKRQSSGGGSDALTANNGPSTDRGYVFESCIVRSECPVVSFGRAWNNTPTTTFLNTIVDYSKGEFSFTGSGIKRWTIDLMNANAWPKFGEYNTMTKDGTVLTPETNMVEFNDPKNSNAKKTIETVLTPAQAAVFTMDYTLGEWSATAAADAKQVELSYKKDGTLNATDATVFLVEKDGKISMETGLTSVEEGAVVRAANARGGFGKPAKEEGSASLIDQTVSNSQVTKELRNGQLIIIRDGRAYNALGATL